MNPHPQRSFSPSKPRPIRNENRPRPLSNEDALDLTRFINANDPRYTARSLTTGHTDFPYRAQCFSRDNGGYAVLYHSVHAYGADARLQVKDPQFQKALEEWLRETDARTQRG